MYAGTTFRKGSGGIVGVHQKIDRISRRFLGVMIHHAHDFPTSRQILHFEGNNGPDAIKRKSPSVDEPWHYIDPTKPNDHLLVDLILDHYHNLSQALRAHNNERAAFEAAWLSHAIVDGLTPAHHYPLDDKIEELWGKPHHERLTIKDKNIIKGINKRDTLSKNWQYWGAGGVFTSHFMFEWGVASAIAPDSFKVHALTIDDVNEFLRDGLEAVFMRTVHAIAEMQLYDEFGRTGWTRRLATVTRKTLVPNIIKVVTLAWYGAYLEANKEVS